MANSRVCSIPECSKSYYAKGYCGMHYQRMLKYGDPLGGGTFQGDLLRFIHDVALPHTSDDCLAWPYGTDGNGYGQLTIDGKYRGAHRYVCQLTRGAAPTEDHEAAHNCGNIICVNPHHLAWKTPVQNQADRVDHGTHNRGERNGLSKLTEAEVRAIISMKGVEPQSKLAKRFGVAHQTVGEIHRGKNWYWLTE